MGASSYGLAGAGFICKIQVFTACPRSCLRRALPSGTARPPSSTLSLRESDRPDPHSQNNDINTDEQRCLREPQLEQKISSANAFGEVGAVAAHQLLIHGHAGSGNKSREGARAAAPLISERSVNCHLSTGFRAGLVQV